MPYRKILIIMLTLLFTFCVFNGCQPQPITEPTESPQEPITEPEVVEKPEPEPEPELPGAFFVMIDNHPKARPQINLEKADIVYEFVCEGTFTRYLAGYYSIDPQVVGPIRSARYYFAQTVLPYDTVYVHVGGNMDALDFIKDVHIKDMCDITTASGYFERDSKRRAPHNAYTKTDLILKFAQKRGYTLSVLPELPVAALTGGRKIDDIKIIYGTERYPNSPQWMYQESDDNFLRYLNGEVYETVSGENIVAANLIIIEAPVKTVKVPVDGVQSEIDIIGKGRALFVRNGKIYSGMWQKESVDDHFVYRLDDGRMWVYESGNVWVQQVDSLDKNCLINFSDTQ